MALHGQGRGSHHQARGTKSQQMENVNRGTADFWTDGVFRATKLRAGEGTLERAVQHLYPLKLTCDRENVKRSTQFNPEAPTFWPRLDAAVAVKGRFQDINADTD